MSYYSVLKKVQWSFDVIAVHVLRWEASKTVLSAKGDKGGTETVCKSLIKSIKNKDTKQRL